MAKKDFIDILERKGYNVKVEKIEGGFSNDVKRIIAEKDGKIAEYFFKKYGSKEEMNSMLRGYGIISGKIKTPTIVYNNPEKREVVYDILTGKSIKSLIEKGDRRAENAVYQLAKEIQKLHEIEEYNPRYSKGDSSDEVKIRKNAIKVFKKGRINSEQLNQIQRGLREYIPKKKRIIQGDAHLGNFMYTDSGELYMIDLDNVKLSDPNADLGKIVESIDQLENERKINGSKSNALKKLFLDMYRGEDQKAIYLHQLRTPLIRTKQGDKEAIPRIRNILSNLGSLEARVAASIIAISLIFSLIGRKISGFVFLEKVQVGNFSNILLIFIILGLFVYFIFKKKNY